MPELGDLFGQTNRPSAFGHAQCWEARVSAVNARGVFVIVPAFDRRLRWGPLMPPGVRAAVGDRIAVAMSDQGRPWLISPPPTSEVPAHA